MQLLVCSGFWDTAVKWMEYNMEYIKTEQSWTVIRVSSALFHILALVCSFFLAEWKISIRLRGILSSSADAQLDWTLRWDINLSVWSHSRVSFMACYGSLSCWKIISVPRTARYSATHFSFCPYEFSSTLHQACCGQRTPNIVLNIHNQIWPYRSVESSSELSRECFACIWAEHRLRCDTSLFK